MARKSADVDVKVDRIHKWNKKESNVKASVDITLNIEGLEVKIYNTSLIYSPKSKEYFVQMPNRKGTDDNYYSYVYIADKDVMEQIANVVLAEYEK